MNNNKLYKHLWYTLDEKGDLKISVGQILMETVKDCKGKSSDEIADIVDNVLQQKSESIKLTEKLFC